MKTPAANRHAPVVCLEGPSAVGKTTLAGALARECGAPVVAELDNRAAPAGAESASWFVERHATDWQRARSLAAGAPFAVMDGDPFKGLWYNWVYEAEGSPGPEIVVPLYRAHLRRGTIDFPDLYVVLGAAEAQLRRRRAGDPTRTRRGFEKHLLMIAPQRRYFAALREAAPARVVFLDSSRQSTLVGLVVEALRSLPKNPPDSARLFEHMADWVRHSRPDAERAAGPAPA